MYGRHVLMGINMKLMFNEVGGRKFNTEALACRYCVFDNSKWCNSIDPSHPLYRWCESEIYRETSLDIFDL